MIITKTSRGAFWLPLKIEGKRKILKKSVEGSFTLKGLGGYSFNGLKRKKNKKKGR